MPSVSRPRVDLRGPVRMLGCNRDLRLLLGAGLVSLSGDWLLGVGLAYAVYALTGSTLASAATLLSSFIPQVLVGSVAGVFVDRWDRKRTMVVCNLLMAAGLLPLLLVGSTDRIWVVYAVLAVEACIEVFFGPAEQALLPKVVPDADLLSANAVNGQVRDISRLVGSASGGVAAAVGGIGAVALTDAATFLVGAWLVARIRTPGRALDGTAELDEDAGHVVSGRVGALVAEWKVGLRTVAANHVVKSLVIALLITSVGEGIMGTLFAPYVRHVLHGSAAVYGVITGVQAIGGILGGFAVAVVADRWSPVSMVWIGAVVFGLVDLAIFLYPLLWVTPWPAAVGMILVGLPGAAVMAGVMTLFQRHTTDHLRGRVFSLLSLAQAVSVVVGATLAGLLGGSVGIMPVLAWQGIGYVVAGLLLLVLLDRKAAETQSAGSLDLPGTRS